MSADASAQVAPRPAAPRVGFRTRVLILATRLLQRVPTGLSQRVAYALGSVLYRTQRARRSLVRANLQRVVDYLVAHDMANEQTKVAASDPEGMDRLVRAAFGHYVRGYLESAILPVYGTPDRLQHVQADDWSVADQAFKSGPNGKSGRLIIVGLHFGAIEIPGLWASRTLGARITAPMETIGDAGLQAYFERARAGTGMNVIPTQGAASELRAALERDEIVALVADRPVGGVGSAVELFGAPARLPAGPAVLADETGAPAWLIVTRRVGWSDYRSRIEQISPITTTDSRRDRLTAFLDAEARAFERAIADAPEQWWTIFFPIWPDIR
ncbi:MAG TPA: lysophospholipid acyltransferase family protein [Candidatus Limnocylindria bacterium]|nr:lysophospholipid acyltransferase family protein [Candidatus Limnocylindria bacterium]